MDEPEIPQPIVALGLSATSDWEQTPPTMRDREPANRAESLAKPRVNRVADNYAAKLFGDREFLWLKKVRKEEPVAIVLRNVPNGMNWGWYAREDERMHLQTLNDQNKGKNEYKIWLETQGSWGLTWNKKPPSGKDANAVERALADERERIEASWAAFMIDKSWLSVHLAGSIITVTAYPNSPTAKFQRTIDLHAQFPGAAVLPANGDIGLSAETASVVVWKNRSEDRQHHIPLSGFLWK